MICFGKLLIKAILCLFIVAETTAVDSEFYQHVGCYKDERVRALSMPLSLSITSVEECYQLAKEKGFLYFGTQYRKECWSSDNAGSRYNMYGEATNCEGGLGGNLSNDVYVIVISFPVSKCYNLQLSFRYKLNGFISNINNISEKIESYLENTTKEHCSQVRFNNASSSTIHNTSTLRIDSSVTITTRENISLEHVNSTLLNCTRAIENLLNISDGPKLNLTGIVTDQEMDSHKPYMKDLRFKSCCGKSHPPCCPSGSKRRGNETCVCSRGFYFNAPNHCRKCQENTYQDKFGRESCKACPNDTNTTCGRTGVASKRCCLNGCNKTCPKNRTTINNQTIDWNSTASRKTVKLFCPDGTQRRFSRRCRCDGTWGPVKVFNCSNATRKTCQENTTRTAAGEISWPETNAGIISNVTCPNGTNTTKATRFCLHDGNWGEANTTECVKNKSLTGKTCQENTTRTAAGEISWPETNAGIISNVTCPNGTNTTKATRFCLHDGNWGEANTTECVKNKSLTGKTCQQNTTRTAAGEISWPQTNAGIISNVTCPNGTNTTKATRFCLHDGNWGEVNTTECVKNKSLTGKTCQENTTRTAAGEISWPQTNAGIISNVTCPNGTNTTKATRFCLHDGNWGEVNTTECVKNKSLTGKTCQENTTRTAAGEISWPQTNAGIISNVTCPNGTNTTKATRFCLHDGNWGEVNTTECVKNKSLTGKTCQENTTRTAAGEISWPQTNAGMISNVTCPNGTKSAKATRSCSINGDWGEAITSKCHIQSVESETLNKISKERVTKENSRRMTANLKNFTTKYNAKNLNAKDMDKIAGVLEGLLNITETLEETGNDVAFIFDKVLDVNKSAMNSKLSKRMADGIETLAQNLPIPPMKTSQTIHTANFIITTSKINTESTKPLLVDLGGKSRDERSTIDNKETFTLPLEFIQSLGTREEKQRKLGTVLYSSSKLFSTKGPFNTETNTSSTLNSRIMSASISGIKVKNLSKPIVMNYTPLKETLGSIPECVYWDFEASGGKGAWSGEGCERSGYRASDGRITCQCYHMTNFAVLFSPHSVESDGEHGSHTMALTLISYIGCGISLLGLFITFLTYILFRNLRKTNAQPILISLCLALMLLMIVFLISAAVDVGGTGCRVVAALIHYSMLAVVMWMAVEGYQMYLAFVKVMATYQRSFMLKSSIVGWCLPALFVVPTVAAATDYYGNGKICVLHGIPFYVSMFAPTIFIILVNFIVFFFVMWSLARSGQMFSAEKRSSSFQRCCTAVAITLLLGLSWIFGGLAFASSFTDSASSKKAHLVFEYLFCIFNSLQGLFIFLFHCARHKEVWSHWTGLLSGNGLSSYSSQHYQRSRGIGESSDGKCRPAIGKLFSPRKTSTPQTTDHDKSKKKDFSSNITKTSSVYKNSAFEASA